MNAGRACGDREGMASNSRPSLPPGIAAIPEPISNPPAKFLVQSALGLQRNEQVPRITAEAMTPVMSAANNKIGSIGSPPCPINRGPIASRSVLV
jgi:hypothetical protein